MTNDYVISTTYLKLLASEPELIDVLKQVAGNTYQRWFEKDYVHRSEIQPVFEAFADAGLDSWVMRFGDRLNITAHGPLGFSVLSAANLHTALQVFSEYSCIRTTAYVCILKERENRLSLTITDQTGAESAGRWLAEAGMQAAQQLIENLMTHPLRDNALIRFTHQKPSYADELEAYFRIPCEYEADENEFSIPVSWGSIASPLADLGTFRTNLAKCKEIKHALSQHSNVLEAVQIRLEQFFNDCVSGQTTPSKLPTLIMLANELAVSPRTLARRLEKQNSSYKAELEEARRSQASYLLLNTHLRVADVSYYLAYQEPANFIRAFKHWFDATPTQWRRAPQPAAHKRYRQTPTIGNRYD